MPRAETPATQTRIARMLGISQVTVHRALAGHPQVSPSTRQRVQELANRLGYRPNGAARAMRGRFDAVTLVLSTVGHRSSLFAPQLQGILAGLGPCGYHLNVAAFDDQELTDPALVPKLLREHLADGLLVNYSAQVPAAMLELMRASGLPAVWMNSKTMPGSVHPDDQGGAASATRQLLALGHRRIAYLDLEHEIGDDYHYSVLDRWQGYALTMQEAGLPSRLLGGQKFPLRERLAAAVAWLSGPERPTAVISYHDGEAMLMQTAAMKCGLRIPQDLSLIALGEHGYLFVGHADLTRWVAPFQELGRRAAVLLVERLRDGTPPGSAVALPFSLHPGETVAPPPG